MPSFIAAKLPAIANKYGCARTSFLSDIPRPVIAFLKPIVVVVAAPCETATAFVEVTLDNSAAVVFSVSPVSPLLANIPSICFSFKVVWASANFTASTELSLSAFEYPYIKVASSLKPSPNLL